MASTQSTRRPHGKNNYIIIKLITIIVFFTSAHIHCRQNHTLPATNGLGTTQSPVINIVSGCLVTTLLCAAGYNVYRVYEEKHRDHLKLQTRELKDKIIVPETSEDNPQHDKTPMDVGIKFERYTLPLTEVPEPVTFEIWEMPVLEKHGVSPQDAVTLMYFRDTRGHVGYDVELYRTILDIMDVNLVAISYPGYNHSNDKNFDIPVIEPMIKSIMKNYIDQSKLKLRKIIPIGHKFGAIAAATMRCPNRSPCYIGGLVLIDPYTCSSDMIVKPDFVNQIQTVVFGNLDTEIWDINMELAFQDNIVLLIKSDNSEFTTEHGIMKIIEESPKGARIAERNKHLMSVDGPSTILNYTDAIMKYIHNHNNVVDEDSDDEED